jgi:hypothetical protein
VIVAGESTIASALEGGFRAGVPPDGGSIGAAIGAAVAQLEAEQNASITGVLDTAIGWLEAAAINPPG